MQGLRKTFWLLIVLLLTACGGGGGGGDDGGSRSPTVFSYDASGREANPDPIGPGSLSISGTISVSAALAADMDTRDPLAPDDGQPSNNVLANPQLVPSPGLVGGFIGVDTYYLDLFRNPLPLTGDLHDVYRVSLAAGQVVSLQISDYKKSNPYINDFDLLLLELDGTLIDFAAGLGAIETLRAPDTSGEYLLLVTVCANPLFANPPGICGFGRSNYTLTVGQPQGVLNSDQLNLSSEFVLNEALVVYEQEPGKNAPGTFTATASAVNVDESRVGDVHRVSFAPDTPVVQSSSATLKAVSSAVLQQTAGEQEYDFIKVTPEQQQKLATIAAIKSMQRQEDVAWAEPNYLREAQFEPNDEYYSFQWHYPQINLPDAWEDATGSNVTVAVLDTGILPYHPDILGQLDPFNNVPGTGNLHGGYDFVSSTYYSRDGGPADNDPTDPGDGNYFGYSSSFHGTHVAGTIAAATDNGVGIAGVAYGAKIQPIRVLGRGVGTSFDISRGLCFAAGLTTDSCDGVPLNPNPADIINLSLGGTGSSQTEQQLFDEITAAGILVVAAAGNSSTSRPFYPASYDGVFGVSAVDIESNLAPYSNYGAAVDLAAPGGNSSRDINQDGYIDGVVSTGGNDSDGVIGEDDYIYPFYQGTSMAAPHVAGVFALMRSVNAGLDTAGVKQLLRDGFLTTRLGVEPVGQKNNLFGYGMIDAKKAVDKALSLGGVAPTPVPWLAAVPNNINFGATLDTIQFELRNSSGGSLNVNSITTGPDSDWLIAPAVIGPDGLGVYDLDINRADPSVQDEGVYQGTLIIDADSNDVIINVIMQVNAALEFGDVGHIYVRLIDEATGNIRQVQADAVDGEYVWSMDDLGDLDNRIPAGNYKLVAFTDADYDGRVCDVGEACGAYGGIAQPEVINLTADMTALNFSMDYLDTGVEFGVTSAPRK
jgi:serine protease